ncbi:MAG TPA: hypothetical protein VMJ10_26275 [Kofleriaceae bacterium]|nr:hypothetical protein [Kofleriaceae bacterium]
MAIAIVLGATATARAGDIGVVVTGEATLQPQLAASLESWLRQHGHKLLSSPLEADATNALIDCFVLEDLACARNVVERRAKSEAIVYTRIEVSPGGDGMGDVTLIGYWLQKGHDAIGERRTCSHCNAQQLANTAEDLVTALAAEPPPASAGAPAKAPPPVVATAPAPEAALTATARPDADRSEASSTVMPKVLVGAGGALAVTGIVMIASNGKPSPTGPQQPTYRDYGPPGYALLATGVVAAGVGAYLWYRAGHQSAPVAAVAPNGAVVGWAGRF